MERNDKLLKFMEIGRRVSLTLIQLFIVVLLLTLIWQINELSYPWLKATLLMAWLTLLLIYVSRVFFFENEMSVTGAHILAYAGLVLCCLFLLWTGNTILKSANYIFIYLEWEFRIGDLFKGIWNYLFSIPALVAGLILFFVGCIWESDVVYRLWYTAITKKIRMA